MCDGDSEVDLGSVDLGSFFEYKDTDSCLGDASGAADLTTSKEECKDTTVSKREMHLPSDEQPGVGDESEGIFQRQLQTIPSSASSESAGVTKSKGKDFDVAKPEERLKSETMVIKHELVELETDAPTITAMTTHKNAPPLNKRDHAHEQLIAKDSDAKIKSTGTKNKGMVVETASSSKEIVNPPAIGMDEMTRASNKRWRSRVALITKALAAWTPSPDMPKYAVSASIFGDAKDEKDWSQFGLIDSGSTRTVEANVNVSVALSKSEKQVEIKTEASLQTTPTTTINNISTKVQRPEHVELRQKEQHFLSNTKQESSQPHSQQTDVSLDADQQAAIDAALNGESFFLTGSAGTGKSFVLKRIISLLRNMGLSVVVTASTGCAAVAIQGCTIHSASGVGLGMESLKDLKEIARYKKVVRDKLLKPDVLIIDEVSMLDSVLFEKIEAMYTEARKHVGLAVNRGRVTSANQMLTATRRAGNQTHAQTKKRQRLSTSIQQRGGGDGIDHHQPKERQRGNGDFVNSTRKRSFNADKDDDGDLPFGGIQIIVCGDFFQLPPVSASDRKLRNTREKYFAFACDAWQRALRRTVVLRQVHRQSDRHFVGLLNELRYGIVTHKTMRVLSACRVAGCEGEAYDDGTPVHYTKLYAYRAQVDAENSKRLEALRTRAVAYSAKDVVDKSKLGGLHPSAVEQMLKNTRAVERTVLKTGARVLCVKNIDQAAGIVNGSAGTVVGFTLPSAELAKRRLAIRSKLTEMEYREKLMRPFTTDGLIRDEVVSGDHDILSEYIRQECSRGREDGVPEVDVEYGQMLPVVSFDNGVTRTMACESWGVFGLSGQEIACRKQVPLVLGWALTIHKAQGMTLELVETDVGRAFDFGQVYVAVSRARQMQGLRLTTFNAQKVLAHREVRAFYDEILSSATEEARL